MSEGIDSISLNPDVAITTALRIAEAESRGEKGSRAAEPAGADEDA